MNKKIFAFLAAGLTLFACREEIREAVDPEISVDPVKIETSYAGEVCDIDVTANTGWVLERTDAEGNEISWVKVDRLNGKGSCAMQVKILENKGTEERTAVLKFIAGDLLTSFLFCLAAITCGNIHRMSNDSILNLHINDPVASKYSHVRALSALLREK